MGGTAGISQAIEALAANITLGEERLSPEEGGAVLDALVAETEGEVLVSGAAILASSLWYSLVDTYPEANLDTLKGLFWKNLFEVSDSPRSPEGIPWGSLEESAQETMELFEAARLYSLGHMPSEVYGRRVRRALEEIPGEYIWTHFLTLCSGLLNDLSEATSTPKGEILQRVALVALSHQEGAS